jgi:hypothetical protein
MAQCCLSIQIGSSQTFYQCSSSLIQDLGRTVGEGDKLTQDDFDKILLSAVEEGLCLLGDSSKQAIIFHLESSFQLKEENIPSNLTGFKKALEEIFGLGATYLEEIIVKRLHEKLGLRFQEAKSTDFLEYVEIAENRIIQKGDVSAK